MISRVPPLCPQCGSVLSIVTWTCVRGDYCKPSKPPTERTIPTTCVEWVGDIPTRLSFQIKVF